MKKALPKINGQTKFEKFTDFVAFRFSVPLFFAIHIGSMAFLLIFLYISQNICNSIGLLNLSTAIWLAAETFACTLMLLSAATDRWALRHEREIGMRIEAYIAERFDCSYDELATHCMPHKVHVGLESAVQSLIYFHKIVRYTDNETVRLRLPTKEEQLTWYIESGATISLPTLRCIFEQIAPTCADHLEIEFFLPEALRFRMGQTSFPGTEAPFWLCSEGGPKMFFDSFEELFSTALVDGKSLRTLWPNAIVTEINGEYAEEWLRVYGS